ncbi:MAG TPA: type II secretion system F family protein [Alphaproteobacteria bacterium]|jgi:tight adherence protein C|nr:type II secretion system F family protein [Alphaproteobacteria bacterium]
MSFADFVKYLPSGMSVEDAVLMTAALAAVLTVIAVWHGLLVRDPTAARIKELARRRDALMADLKIPGRHHARSKGLGFMHRVVSKMKLLRSDQARAVADKLAKAGFRSRDALVAYLFLKLCLPAAVGAVTAFLFYGLEAYALQPMTRLLVVMGCMVGSLFAPDVYLKNITDKRRESIRKGLPDALDLMVICAEAGLSLDAALKRVAKEMALSNTEIADEFGLTSVEIGFLPDRVQALRNLMRRCDLPGVRGVVNTLLQSERYGTPLAQSLRVLSAEYRNERLLKAEEKAARLPAILTVPMILFVLPPLFVVLIGPGALRFVDNMKGLSIAH